MECHRCQYAAAVAAGKYRRRRYDRTPCARCALRESSAFTIEFDEERASGADQRRPQDEIEEREAAAEPEPVMPVAVMQEAVAMLLQLPEATRMVVCRRYQGRQYKEIAREQGLTTAAVEMRHKRAMRRWPALAELFALKAAKQRRRKTHRRPTAGCEGRGG